MSPGPASGVLTAFWTPLALFCGVALGARICWRLAVEARNVAGVVAEALKGVRAQRRTPARHVDYAHTDNELLMQFYQAASARERRISYNDIVDWVALVRERASAVPKSIGRICLMSGVGLAVLELARSLQGGSRSVLSAVACLVCGVGGWGLAGLWGARARSSIRVAAEGVRSLKSWVDSESAHASFE